MFLQNLFLLLFHFEKFSKTRSYRAIIDDEHQFKKFGELGNRHTRESARREKVQEVDPRVINLRAAEPPLILLRRILTL